MERYLQLMPLQSVIKELKNKSKYRYLRIFLNWLRNPFYVDGWMPKLLSSFSGTDKVGVQWVPGHNNFSQPVVSAMPKDILSSISK